jgi:hypothetical protein
LLDAVQNFFAANVIDLYCHGYVIAVISNSGLFNSAALCPLNEHGVSQNLDAITWPGSSRLIVIPKAMATLVLVWDKSPTLGFNCVNLAAKAESFILKIQAFPIGFIRPFKLRVQSSSSKDRIVLRVLLFHFF